MAAKKCKTCGGPNPVKIYIKRCPQCGKQFEVSKPNGKECCTRSCASKWRVKTQANPGGRSRTKSGVREDLGNMAFRSAWEANYARYLNLLLDNRQILAWEYEPKRFYFPIRRGTISYLPDFMITLNSADIEWHEVKGYMDQKSRTRLKRFAKYYPDEKLVLIDKSVYTDIAAAWASKIDGWE